MQKSLYLTNITPSFILSKALGLVQQPQLDSSRHMNEFWLETVRTFELRQGQSGGRASPEYHGVMLAENLINYSPNISKYTSKRRGVDVSREVFPSAESCNHPLSTWCFLMQARNGLNFFFPDTKIWLFLSTQPSRTCRRLKAILALCSSLIKQRHRAQKETGMSSQVTAMTTPRGGGNTTKEELASKPGLFCLRRRWVGRAAGIIFKHMKSHWQEGKKWLSMSAADRKRNNELKLQRENARKDIRKK